MYFGTIIIKEVDLKTILALLNSKLLSAIYEFLYSGMHMGGGYLRYRTNFLEQLPFVQNLNNQKSKIITVVDHIFSITKTEDYLQNPQKRAKVKELEHQIDQMVNKLYGLTDEEIAIVEERVKK